MNNILSVLVSLPTYTRSSFRYGTAVLWFVLAVAIGIADIVPVRAKSGSEIYVANRVELAEALKNAKGGETILIEPGNYGNLSLYINRHPYVNYPERVLLRPARGNHDVIFTSFAFSGVGNVTLDGIRFDYKSERGADPKIKPNRITNSHGISIRNAVFDGDHARGVSPLIDGFGVGFGITVQKSKNISIERSKFFDWGRAGVFSDVDNLTLKDNEIFHIRSDGFDFADTDNVIIEGNYFHDFRRAKQSRDHPDMIQFWTSGTQDPSTDITIRRNVLLQRDGDGTQSIFMRNEAVDRGNAGWEMFYKNITIEDNVISNSHAHGITVGETNGLKITNNSLFQSAGSGARLVFVPTINLKPESRKVVVRDNILPRLNLTKTPELHVDNNIVTQSLWADAPHFVGDLLVNPLASTQLALADLAAIPNGQIVKRKIGSSLTYGFQKYSDLNGSIEVTPDSENQFAVTFNASNVFMADRKLDASKAKVAWNFGDGNSSHGLVANHIFKHPDRYDVEAEITWRNGRTVTLRRTIDIKSSTLLQVNFDGDAKNQSNQQTEVSVGSKVRFEASKDGRSARLNGDVISYATSADFFNNRNYTVQFDFKKNRADDKAVGTAIYFSRNFVISIGKDSLTVNKNLNGKGLRFRAKNLRIHNTNWHTAKFTFSSQKRSAALEVDGRVVQKKMDLEQLIFGPVKRAQFHIGSPFGKSFNGLIDNVTFMAK